MGTPKKDQMDSRWRICDYLWESQRSGKFCDLRLETEDHQSIHVHKVMAAVGSPVFQAMLSPENGLLGDQVLVVPKVNFSQLQAIVQLLYIGTTEDRDPGLMELCKELQILEGIRFWDRFQEKLARARRFTLRSDTATSESKKSSAVSKSKKSSALPEEAPTDSTKQDLEIKPEPCEQNPPKAWQELRHLLSPEDDGEGAVDGSDAESEATVPEAVEANEDSFDSDASKSEDSPPPPKRRRGRPARRGRRPAGRPDKDTAAKKIQGQMFRRCKTCNIRFDTVLQYRNHRAEIHVSRNSHRCIDCGKVFKRPKQLVAHKVKEHYEEGMKEPDWYRCKVEGCTYKSIYASSVEGHFNRHHVKEEVPCEICGKLYPSKYCLQQHLRHSHKKKPQATCPTCGKSFTSESLLKSHILRVHEHVKPYLCEKCPYRSFDRNALNQHRFRRHRDLLAAEDSEKFKCPHCNHIEMNPKKLREHIERHFPKKHECSVCKKRVATARDLINHTRNVHSSATEWITCQYEGCTFSCKAIYGQRRLREHIDRMHENRNFKPWTCTECSYRSNIKGNLRLHMKNVHGVRLPTAQHRVNKVVSGDEPPVPPAIIIEPLTTPNLPAPQQAQLPPPPLPPQEQHQPLQQQQPPPPQHPLPPPLHMPGRMRQLPPPPPPPQLHEPLRVPQNSLEYQPQPPNHQQMQYNPSLENNMTPNFIESMQQQNPVFLSILQPAMYNNSERHPMGK